MATRKKLDGWTIVSIIMLVLFVGLLIYPMFGIIKQAVIMPDGSFSFEQFQKFFNNAIYTKSLINSFKITIFVTIVTLVVGIPFAYFYAFYKLKGAKVLFIVSIICCMSAPFLGAYSWVMLLGRAGVITKFFKGLGIVLPTIYGFGGIALAQTLKFFPLVFIYMNGAFKSIDNTLMEASANLGCVGVKRLFNIVLHLTMPTILAASLMVFMQAFADFGTPTILGEGFTTFPVLLYNEYLGENGTDFNFAAALAVIAIIVTAVIFFFQKWATGKFKFSINALHSVEKKKATGVSGVLMHLYCYLLCGFAVLPQVYIIYLSFRNCKGSIFKPGFSLVNYEQAMKKKLLMASRNTVIMGVAALVIIIIVAVVLAYLVVRRSSVLNHTLDTISMLPYIMPGAVIGIALLIAFGAKPFALTGTMTIMILSFAIRRMPYTIRSATATLMAIHPSIEEASISLGASKLKTFFTITVPMMSNGILSGAILSWIAIVTELSSSVILYSNKTATLTMQAYIYIGRGEYGTAAAFAAILTVVTTISLLLYMAISKSEDDIQL
ncbi:MAG: iron ABC transporter permease [Clostridia bacterium]|nr:iron ABC transporter permease [Clostridia bacterium]